MAEIYEKTTPDKVLILGTREYMIYPFVAPNWFDLRVGFFLSLTDVSDDNLITGLAETIVKPDPGFALPQDRYWIGVKTKDSNLPAAVGTSFIGFTNKTREARIADLRGNSVLSSSDIGVGTSDTNFWRPHNSFQQYDNFMFIDQGIPRSYAGTPGNSLAIHFPQDVGGAGGYSVFLGIRLTRDDPASNVITATVKSHLDSADMLYSSVPDNDLVLASMQEWPTEAQQIGPTQLSATPNALYCYWPYHGSRLRIHAVGVLKFQ